MSLPAPANAASAPRKTSYTLLVLAACIFGAVLGLFGLNFWHASRCTVGLTELAANERYNALNRRLIQAESEVIRNTILTESVLKLLQTKLIKIEHEEMELLSKQSQDEAVKIALQLASQPAPPMPEFELDSNYENGDTLADFIDDTFGKVATGASEDGYKSNSEEEASEKSIALSDTEAEEKCMEMKSKYSVVVGVSWGELPYDLQQKWLEYSCDYHMKEA